MNEIAARHILVVDDEDEARTLVCLTLKRAGFDVLAAASGAAAIQQVTAHGATIALVVLGMTLPDMDGEAIFTALHALQPDLHFLIFAGECDPEALQRLLDTGSCAYWGKPTPLAELLEEIQWLVSLHPRIKQG
jgi:CheY-like chemotaxis protein